jgi:hypothetical protein
MECLPVIYLGKKVGLLMLLTLVLAADEKPADVVKSSDLPLDPPNERKFGLIKLVASIWAILRRTMG